MTEVNTRATSLGHALRRIEKKIAQISTIQKLTIAFALLYTIGLAVSVSTLYYAYLNRTKSSLHSLAQRVQEDIKYKDGSWDMSEYNADIHIPGRFRLYVFSSDGFVVERWRPIPGFLDTSDFKYLASYQKPTTVRTITNQTWRMYSKPITNSSNAVIGVIATSYFSPDESKYTEVDQKLENAASIIKEDITVENDQINTNKVDARSVQFDVAFQVVDQYNRILIKNNNVSSVDTMPNFIDSSYVRNELDTNSYRQIKSRDTNDTFLVESLPLVDENNSPYGVAVVASTTGVIYELIKILAVGGALVGILLTGVYWAIVQRLVKNKPEVRSSLLTLDAIENISFLKKECIIRINTHEVTLAYATNQYYLCEALFSSPRKKWEIDELLEKFGESQNGDGWRKVYDAKISVNKKLLQVMHPKLIVNNNKTYQINPKLLSKIT